MKSNLKCLFCVIVMLVSHRCFAEDKYSYRPAIHGTIRTKYEYEPSICKGRFEVRNARVGIDGMVIPIIRYKAEIDLCDEGAIKMLDAYVRLQPVKAWKFTLGQMRVPFSIDAHRSPHLQYFANRSFIAKQAGNVRDVGVMVGWSFGQRLPVTLEGGVFNGSGLTNQKDYWTSNYNFAFKAQTMIYDRLNVTMSMMKANAGEIKTYLYNVGAYYQNKQWHIEAEYLRKYYPSGAFKPVNVIDAFAVCRIPIRKDGPVILILGRYDYMSDHSKGKVYVDGKLSTDDPERHRLTTGVTLSLGKQALQADIRANYEQYFYSKEVTPPISEQSKAVVELVVHF